MKVAPRNEANANEPDIDKEHQQYINEFSRLHAKNKLIDQEVKRIKEIQNSLSDAIAAVDENSLTGTEVKLNIGECFIDVNDDDANLYIEKQQKKCVEDLKNQYTKYESNKKRLDNLKIILYAKLGKAIYLEED